MQVMLSKDSLYLSYECFKFNSEGSCRLQLRCPQTLPTCSRKKWPNNKFTVRSAYTRIPMESAGAYRLIDEETGEKFIVWGGADDDDSPIPSKDVLTWKPGKSKSGTQHAVSVASRNKPVSSMSTFSKLKAQRVRELVKKSTHIKESNIPDRGKPVYEYPDAEETDSSDSESEFEKERNNSGLIVKNKRGLWRKEQIQETEDSWKATSRMMSKKNTSTVVSNDTREFSADQRLSSGFIASNSSDSGRNSSKSRATTSLRGWNNAGSSRRDMVDSMDQWRMKPLDSGFFSRKTFQSLGCSDEMIGALKNLMFLRPSHIQAMAYGSVLEGKSCILADQSGSGKTLSYLAPVVQRLRQQEQQGLGNSSPGNPRVLVLVPTAELASQVLDNCRSISKFGAPFRSMVATGGFRQRTQLENLQQNVDVLIATPGRFIFLLQEGFLQLTNLQCVVLDEVDILFNDEDFGQVFQKLLNSATLATQYLFVTATLPVDIFNKLVELFPDVEMIMGPGMHRTSPGLEEILVDCSGEDVEKNPETAFINKKTALLKLAERNPVSRTIVFCNKIDTCRKVENVLKRFDKKEAQIKVLPFHAALTQELRISNMKEFLSSQSKDSLFLICTDRASRGIDFEKVDHVVLFDFPRDPSEYVRRVGRTARGANPKGMAFIFVVGKQVSLAQRIIDRNKKGHPLHDVPCAYEMSSSF